MKPTLRGDTAEPRAPARGNACRRLATASPDLRSGTATALSNFGDLWLLGRYRVLCGNALERSDFETLMGGEPALPASSIRRETGRSTGRRTVSCTMVVV